MSIVTLLSSTMKSKDTIGVIRLHSIDDYDDKSHAKENNFFI